MAIEFRCGQCGKLLRTGDDTAGRMAQCPECGSQTPIPVACEEQEPEQVDVEVIEPSVPNRNPFAKEADAFFQPSGNFDPYRKQALISFFLGLVSSIFSCCFPVGFFVALFGILGLRSPTAKAAATIGLALSILGMLLSLMMFLIYYLMAGMQNPQQPFPKINP